MCTNTIIYLATTQEKDEDKKHTTKMECEEYLFVAVKNPKSQHNIFNFHNGSSCVCDEIHLAHPAKLAHCYTSLEIEKVTHIEHNLVIPSPKIWVMSTSGTALNSCKQVTT